MLHSLLKPKTIPLIGASQTPRKLGFEILNNLIKHEFKGKVFPINPQAKTILGQKVYASVKQTPEEIDLAVICIPAPFVAEVLEECGKKKVKGAVIISAGFKEMGEEGALREQALQKIAKKYHIRLVGPNCLGVMNTEINMNASFAEGIPKKGNIGLISQSGAMAVAITDWAYKANLGFSKIVSLGNKADVDENELLEFFEKDAQTQVILMYLESIENGERFMEICSRISLKKPIIAIKAGVSECGSQAIFSHTGSLSGSSTAVTSAFEQAGIMRAYSVEDMFDLARALSAQPLPQGNRIAIITNAGGPGVMATDALEGKNLSLAKFEEKTVTTLQKHLPASANTHNPIDIIGDALADRYKIAMEAVLQDKNTDMAHILLTPQVMTEKEKTANAIIELHQKYAHKPIIASFLGGKNIAYAVQRLQEYGIPNFFPERAIKVFESMVGYVAWKRAKQKVQKKFPRIARGEMTQEIHKRIQKTIQKKQQQLDAETTAELLKAYSIEYPKTLLAKSAKEAVLYAKQTGFPVVLKISSAEILHKTEVGGVRIALKNEEEVKNAYEEIMKNIKTHVKHAKIDGILVQKMYSFGKEVIIGMKRDPSFGPLIMFGLGGIYVEVMKDVSFRVAPFSYEEALKMMNEIKAIQLLKGVRGEAPSDMEKLAETILQVSKLAMDFPEIRELDMNPLLVKEKGKGVIAVDTRFIL